MTLGYCDIRIFLHYDILTLGYCDIRIFWHCDGTWCISLYNLLFLFIKTGAQVVTFWQSTNWQHLDRSWNLVLWHKSIFVLIVHVAESQITLIGTVGTCVLYAFVYNCAPICLLCSPTCVLCALCINLAVPICVLCAPVCCLHQSPKKESVINIAWLASNHLPLMKINKNVDQLVGKDFNAGGRWSI